MKLNQQSDSQLESMDGGCWMAVTGYTCSHLDSGVERQSIGVGRGLASVRLRIHI